MALMETDLGSPANNVKVLRYLYLCSKYF